MIDKDSPTFRIEYDPDTNRGEFVRPLSAVIERHMRTSRKLFRPSSLIDDFAGVGVRVSRQAVNSALATLLRRGDIKRQGYGLYAHRDALK